MASSSSSAAAAATGRAVEEVHADVVAELIGRVSTELRGGFAPAVDSFISFFHAVDWKVNTLVTLCRLMVRWKRALEHPFDLRQRAREACSKQG